MSGGNAPAFAAGLRANEGPTFLLKAENRDRIPADGNYTIPVAWPVFAWRVVVPKLSAVEGDPLQRAILRLCNAGVTRSRELAGLLDADVRLIERLLEMFMEAKLLQPNGQLTEQGKKLLENDDAVFFDDTAAELAWIFRDALTGDVLPILHRGSLALDRIDTGVESLPYNAALRERPSILNIAKSLTTYRDFVERRLHAQDVLGPESQHVMGQTLSDVHQLESLPRTIRIVSRNPERIALPAWFGVQSDDPSYGTWVTGFAEADMDYWLEQRFDFAARTNSQIRSIHDRWLKGARDAFPTEPTVESEEEKIRREMAFFSDPKLHGACRELARARRGEALFAADPENLDTVLSRYYKAVEAVMSAVIQDLSDRSRTARCFTALESVVRAEAETLATRLHAELPSRFLAPTYLSLAKKLDRKPTWNPLVNGLFLLFNAGLNPEGKVRKCFSTEPTILKHVEHVYEIRNSYSGHYSTNTPSNADDLVNSMRCSAERITAVLGTTYFA